MEIGAACTRSVVPRNNYFPVPEDRGDRARRVGAVPTAIRLSGAPRHRPGWMWKFEESALMGGLHTQPGLVIFQGGNSPGCATRQWRAWDGLGSHRLTWRRPTTSSACRPSRVGSSAATTVGPPVQVRLRRVRRHLPQLPRAGQCQIGLHDRPARPRARF